MGAHFTSIGNLKDERAEHLVNLLNKKNIHAIALSQKMPIVAIRYGINYVFFNIETERAIFGVTKKVRKYYTNNNEMIFKFSHNDKINGIVVSKDEILNNFHSFAKYLSDLESSVDSPKREIASTPNDDIDIIHGCEYDLGKFLNLRKTA